VTREERNISLFYIWEFVCFQINISKLTCCSHIFLLSHCQHHSSSLYVFATPGRRVTKWWRRELRGYWASQYYNVARRLLGLTILWCCEEAIGPHNIMILRGGYWAPQYYNFCIFLLNYFTIRWQLHMCSHSFVRSASAANLFFLDINKLGNKLLS
jgi:hypothetical protein